MRVIVFTILIISLAACRSTRPIQTAIAKKDTVAGSNAKEDSVRFIQQTYEQLNANRINYQTFTAKLKIDYSGSDGKKYDVNANIRMLKDSAIWISANAVLGIEALRVLVTKDSVKLLDKLNKTYTARSVDYLQEVTSLPLNLSILQNLIIGNPVFLDSNIVSYSQTAGSIALLGVNQWFKNLVTVSEKEKALQRSKLDDVDITRNRTADLTYMDYENKKGPLFATKRNITISEKKKLEIKLDFKQYEFGDEVSFPFSIPKNFASN
jgi:outer membrane biogenesis lipoprotein LolB